MQTVVFDTNVVGEVTATLFTMPQAGPVNALVTIRNTGVNTLNYVFQEFNGTTWVDLGVSGTDFNDTLAAAEVKSFALVSAYSQLRLQANATGGATLEFSIARYYNRASGGQVPLLAL